MSSTDGESEMRTMADKATYDRLEKDIEAVKNDMSALGEQITEALNAFAGSARKEARRGYKRARANVDSVMSDMNERGNAALEAAQDAAATLEDTLEDAIHQRPIAAIGLAVGLGFLIGVTWRR